jgi:hypothetical protein
MRARTVLERGPKGKKAVAFAVDWPGWSRGAKTPELAPELLESYRERYRPVALAVRMADEFDAAGPIGVVEDRIGTGSTDFWGISFSPSGFEREPMGGTEIDRKIGLLCACWEFFDAVAARVSAEMRKVPRGGGRDRDQIIRHTTNGCDRGTCRFSSATAHSTRWTTRGKWRTRTSPRPRGDSPGR